MLKALFRFFPIPFPFVCSLTFACRFARLSLVVVFAFSLFSAYSLLCYTGGKKGVAGRASQQHAGVGPPRIFRFSLYHSLPHKHAHSPSAVSSSSKGENVARPLAPSTTLSLTRLLCTLRRTPILPRFHATPFDFFPFPFRLLCISLLLSDTLAHSRSRASTLVPYLPSDAASTASYESFGVLYVYVRARVVAVVFSYQGTGVFELPDAS